MVAEAMRAVVVVDDNPRVLALIARVVARGGFVAAAFGTLAVALDHIDTFGDTPPAAAIIDVYLERGRTGFELSERLRERFGNAVPILMLTGYPGELSYPYVAHALDDESPISEDIVPVCSKPVGAALLNRFLARAAASAHLRASPPPLRHSVVAYALRQRLTPQESRILAQLACGSTRSTLSADLGLSKETVKSQIRNVLEKCSVSATDELVASLLRYISRTDAPQHIAADVRRSTFVAR